jgi:hypothetical protein
MALAGGRCNRPARVGPFGKAGGGLRRARRSLRAGEGEEEGQQEGVIAAHTRRRLIQVRTLSGGVPGQGKARASGSAQPSFAASILLKDGRGGQRGNTPAARGASPAGGSLSAAEDSLPGENTFFSAA